jgi:hypothetical protein
MTNQELKTEISKIRDELDGLLAVCDRESIMKSIVLLNRAAEIIFNKDDGIRRVYLFQKIWTAEMACGEPSIFADVRSVSDVVRKNRLIRQAFFRLENDFPAELCIEAMQVISDFNLSNSAFREILAMEIEDEDKVIARIGEISKMALG